MVIMAAGVYADHVQRAPSARKAPVSSALRNATVNNAGMTVAAVCAAPAKPERTAPKVSALAVRLTAMGVPVERTVAAAFAVCAQATKSAVSMVSAIRTTAEISRLRVAAMRASSTSATTANWAAWIAG